MVEAQRSGKGQVVDAAMTEGAASLMTTFYGLYAAGLHKLERGTNLLDSGSAIYEVYECADGHYISIAPIELKFRKVLFELLGLPYTADDGPRGARQAGRDFSGRGPGTNGARCWRGRTPASRRFSPWRRRRTIRTMSPAAPSSKSMAWCNRGPRRASAARLPDSPTPPRALGEGTHAALAEWGIANERIETLFAAGVLGGSEAKRLSPA